MNFIFSFIFKKMSPIGYARWIGVKVGKNCRLINVSFSSEPYLITIGDHVSATATRFETHDGGVWILRNKNKNIDVIASVTIGSNVFIGYGSTILPGVKIGDNVVIGANSVVSKNIPSNVVAAGVPAKIIKSIDEYEKGLMGRSDNTKNLNAKEKKAYYIEKMGSIKQ